MFFTTIKTAAYHYPGYFLKTLGLFWLIVEPTFNLTGISFTLTYPQLIYLSLVMSLLFLIISGFWISGFLRHSIRITSSAFDTQIIIKFGDLFRQDGWKAIAVNVFFDSVVDDRIISSRSLHGILLQKIWPGDIDDWDRQADEQLAGRKYTEVDRLEGKTKFYDIGTTISAEKNGHNFLCVALSHTDVSSHEAKANSADLLVAVTGLLRKARSVCSNNPLSIPLFGSGLSRVGLNSNILIDLILTAIFEETKTNKVTGEIRIVLPKEKVSEINLAALKKSWS